MTISGSGTAASPYIVDNWADYLTVVAQSGVYIKWAEVPNKTIDSITIDAPIPIQATETDFNGWTFKNVTITQTAASYPYSGEPAILRNIINQGTCYNLHVEKLHFNDVKVVLARGLTGYNIFVDEITGTELNKTDSYWTSGADVQTGYFTGFTGLYLCNSIIKIKTKNACMRIPHNTYTWCEIYLDYKYELDNAVPRYNDIIMGSAEFNYCYVGGKIDLRNGSGQMSLCRTITTSQVVAGGIKSQGSIFNFETYVGNDSSIIENYSGTTIGRTAWSLTSPLTLFVTNNGNNYNGWSTYLTLPQTTTTLGDLKNPEYLTEKSFQYITDDLVRYPYYDKTNAYQNWTFRKSFTVNSGIPFLPFWKYTGEEPPEQNGDVEENPYITVYDMETKQNEFSGHGLAVLRPTSGTITEELNGCYTLTMTHPHDEENRWQYILEMNIVKALGQLFVIQKVNEVQSGGSAYVNAYAEHITYTLNDKWIFPPVTIAGFAGQTLIDSIMTQATDLGYDWQTTYTFTVTTNLDPPDGFRDWYEMPDGVTPYEMLIGGNGFTAKIGGELYRDNFTMSINERMQGAQDNAFELAIGYNLTGIKRTVDLTTFCTYLRGYDVTDGNYETWFAIGWDPSTLPRPYPREVVRSVNFTYDHPEYAEGQLERDTMNFFNQNCAPLVSYELNVVDLKRNPDYKMFTNNYRYKVGDKGRVWDERLQAWLELEITRTEKDIITGECKRVVIGSQRSFTRPVGYTPYVPRGIIIPAAQKVLEGVPPLVFTTTDEKVVDWTIYGASGGVGEASVNDYPPYNSTSLAWLLWSRDSTDYNGQPVYYASHGWSGLCNEIYLDIGTYTFSAYVKSDTASTPILVAVNEWTGAPHEADKATLSNTGMRKYYITTDFVRYELTFEVTAAGYVAPRVDKDEQSDAVIYVSSPQMETGSTATDFQEYGKYIIPVTVSAEVEGEPVEQTVNIALNAPLNENDTITLASTGVDIPTYSGVENTLDVDTTVTPRVKIIYTEEVE